MMLIAGANLGIGRHAAHDGQDIVNLVIGVGIVHDLGDGVAGCDAEQRGYRNLVFQSLTVCALIFVQK